MDQYILLQEIKHWNADYYKTMILEKNPIISSDLFFKTHIF